MAQRAIGIDIGSSSIKGAILDLELSRLMEVRSRPFPVPLSTQPPRHFVVPLEKIVEQVRGLVSELLSLDSEASVHRLLFSSQMGGVVIDALSSEQSSMYISWRDERATEWVAHGVRYIDEIRVKLGESCMESLGNELKPGSTLALLYWLTQNHRIEYDSRGAWLALPSSPRSRWFFNGSFERRDRRLGSSDQGVEPRGVRASGASLGAVPQSLENV